MAYSVRHQIFVSSTFTDLVEERSEVIQALWELDCIPTGMEAFVASNESQWEVIRKVIDECDYYVLIIGGRYGSQTSDGISYTEKEYDYAKKIGLPVLAFVHGQPDTIPVGKTEKDESGRLKLEAFRTKVKSEHPVRNWASASELGGLVSRSLVREIKVSPRPGWIRNDGTSPIALLEQINLLSEENNDLRANRLSQVIESADPGLEQGSDIISVYGDRLFHNSNYTRYRKHWNVSVSWDDLFRDIGPALINEATEGQIRHILERFHTIDSLEDKFILEKVDIAPESFNEILIQFRALGLIDQGVKKRGVNDRESYWRITTLGDRHLVSLLARRRKVNGEIATA